MSSCSPFVRLFTTTAQNNKPIQGILSDMSVAKACELLNSRKLTYSEVDQVAFSFAKRDDVSIEDVEIAIKALYRIKHYSRVVHFFNVVQKLHSGVRFSTRSTELVFESILLEKQYTLLDTLWALCPEREQKKWGVMSLYTRGLLASHRTSEAKVFLARIEFEGYTIPVANSQVLQGLYEGGYLDECLRYFEVLLPIDNTYQILGDRKGIECALLAAHQLRRKTSITTIDGVMEKLGLKRSKEVLAQLKAIHMDLRNIALNGSWSVSSAELGHGVGNIIDDDLTTYWQSKAEQPHAIYVNFTTKQMISSIKFYISYAMDATYSPLLVSILYGQDGQQYKEFKTFSISEMNGWYTVDTFQDNHPLKAFSLQFVIHEMHHSGKNTRIRQIQILSPEMIPLQINKLFTYSDPILQSQITVR